MQFPDLTPYSYTGADPRYLNVGWLGHGTDFPTGDCPRTFTQRLLRLCADPVNVCRGVHVCDLCPGAGPGAEEGPLIVRDGWAAVELGNGEVQVPAGGRAGRGVRGYRAPTLIYHYVTAHRYRPPQEFIDAVLGLAVAPLKGDAGGDAARLFRWAAVTLFGRRL